jgi:hypothetical protein
MLKAPREREKDNQQEARHKKLLAHRTAFTILDTMTQIVGVNAIFRQLARACYFRELSSNSFA